MRLALALLVLAVMAATSHADTDQEKAVKAYYQGFETHDWSLVTTQLADGFTFTTPINDHIKLPEFKDQCWGTNKFFKAVKFVKLVPSGDGLLLLVEITTTDNKVVRNMDAYTFDHGKIKTVEVFFGAGESYPGQHSK